MNNFCGGFSGGSNCSTILIILAVLYLYCCGNNICDIFKGNDCTLLIILVVFFCLWGGNFGGCGMCEK